MTNRPQASTGRFRTWTTVQLRVVPTPDMTDAAMGFFLGFRGGGRLRGVPEEPAGRDGRRAGALPLRGGGFRVLVLVATGVTTLTTVNSNNSISHVQGW